MDELELIKTPGFWAKMRLFMRMEGVSDDFIQSTLWLMVYGLSGFIAGMISIIFLLLDFAQKIKWN